MNDRMNEEMEALRRYAYLMATTRHDTHGKVAPNNNSTFTFTFQDRSTKLYLSFLACRLSHCSVLLKHDTALRLHRLPIYTQLIVFTTLRFHLSSVWNLQRYPLCPRFFPISAMSRSSLFLTYFLYALFALGLDFNDRISAGAHIQGRDSLLGGSARSTAEKGDGSQMLFEHQDTPFLAPMYRSVSPGAAWVLPGNAFDLTFRSLACECFDPDGRLSIPLGSVESCWIRQFPLICGGNRS